MDEITWETWLAKHRAFEEEQRAAGKPWRDIPSPTAWTMQQLQAQQERIAALESEISRLMCAREDCQ